jgi:carboxypeptidase Q
VINAFTFGERAVTTRLTLSCMCILLWASSMAASAAPASNAVDRIADAGFNHSEVVDTAAYLADEIGGRMTNSPAMRKAESWTQEKFKAWGLKDVRAEAFDFGRGWWIESSHVRMIAPRPLELRAIPIAWTPATNGVLTGEVIVAPMISESDFAEWKGKLAGKIVLVTWPAPPKDDGDAPFQRLTDADIKKFDTFEQPTFDPAAIQKRIERFRFRSNLDAFLAQEGALAWAQMSRTEGRLVHGEGSGYRVGKTPKLPGLELGAEDYRRLARLAKRGEVRVEIDSRIHFEDADHNAYNILADIPGEDARAGYVMAGAHLDSWVAGDGAADNGAGSAVVMEAARILAGLGARPRRTIRFALWAGEEEGLLGSAARRSSAGRPAAFLSQRLIPCADAAGICRNGGLFQYRQWVGENTRHFHGRKSCGRSHFSRMADSVCQSRRKRGCCGTNRQHGPCVLEPLGAAGVSIHPGPLGLLESGSPHGPRHL